MQAIVHIINHQSVYIAAWQHEYTRYVLHIGRMWRCTALHHNTHGLPISIWMVIAIFLKCSFVCASTKAFAPEAGSEEHSDHTPHQWYTHYTKYDANQRPRCHYITERYHTLEVTQKHGSVIQQA